MSKPQRRAEPKVNLEPATRVFEFAKSDRVARPLKDKYLRGFYNDIWSGVSFKKAAQNRIKANSEFLKDFDVNLTSGREKLLPRLDLLYPSIELPTNYLISDNKSILNVKNQKHCESLYKRSPSAALNLFSDLASGLYTKRQIVQRNESLIADKYWPTINDLLVKTRSTIYSFDQPGLHRLQHACLLLKTKRAGVLVDPLFRTLFDNHSLKNSILPFEVVPEVDAIVISHTHTDHYSPLTLSMFSKSMPIFVPNVERGSLVSSPIFQELRLAGFTNVRELRWGESAVVEDIEINAMPFYGEQATSSEDPVRSDLRNIGNTYVFRTSTFSAWALVDSGQDNRGGVIDVAHAIAEKFGPVDVVLSNIREFKANACVGNNWFSLAADQWRRFQTLGQEITTASPQTLAEVCKLVRAKTFLPYAQWWNEPGQRIIDRENLLERVRFAFKSQKLKTIIKDWNISDRFLGGQIYKQNEKSRLNKINKLPAELSLES